MPEVRWDDNQGHVPHDVLRWMLVQGVKQKTPEPNAVLRKYCAMFDSRDREAIWPVRAGYMAARRRPTNLAR